MNSERRSAVNAFLDEIGRAPVPAGLAHNAMTGVRADRTRRGRPQPQIALAAALGIAVLAIGAFIVGSGPTVTPSPSPSFPTPTLSPSAIESLEPTPTPPITGSWQLTLPLFQERSFRLEVADQSGRLIGARVVDPVPPDVGGGLDDPFVLDIRPVQGNTREVLVGWLVLVCDYRGRLLLDEAGTSLSLQLAPSPACELAPIAQAVILEFAADVDAATLSGRQSRDPLVAFDQFVPSSIAFADQQVGWIGGTTPDGDALVLHTLHNGSEWAISGLGEGQVAGITAVDQTHAYATVECAEHQFHCRSGTFEWDDDFGGWGRMTNERFVRMHFAGDLGIAVVLPDDTTSPIVPELRLTDDAGDTWSPVDDPCPASMNLADADRTSPPEILVLCLAEGGTGATFKTLLASSDRGATWIERASTDGSGLLLGGTPSGFDMNPDRSGWLWGSRMPLLETIDAGVSWPALDVADGDVKFVLDASYLGDRTGFILLHDPDRSAAIHLWTNGRTWTEIGVWPLR